MDPKDVQSVKSNNGMAISTIILSTFELLEKGFRHKTNEERVYFEKDVSQNTSSYMIEIRIRGLPEAESSQFAH